MRRPEGTDTQSMGAAAVEVALLGVAATAIPDVPCTPHELPADPSREDLGRIVELLRTGDREVVVIVPNVIAAHGRQRLQTAASALGGRPIAFHMTALSGLGVATLGALAAGATPHVASAGVLAGALPALERELTAAAVLRGVARLTSPRPGFGQRLRGLLPGTLFAARGGDGPVVASADRRAPGAALAALLPADSATVLAARGRGTRHGEQTARVIADATGAAPLQAPEQAAGLPGGWGREPLLEAVAWPAEQAAMLQRVFGRPFVPCPWCDRPAAVTPCPTCGHDRNPALSGALGA